MVQFSKSLDWTLGQSVCPTRRHPHSGFISRPLRVLSSISPPRIAGIVLGCHRSLALCDVGICEEYPLIFLILGLPDVSS